MKLKYMKEYFSYPDILIMSCLFLISFGYMMLNFTSIIILGTFILGMMMYSLAEYLIHRFVFHLKPPKSAFLLKMLKRLHYDHHAHPNELHLLFLPLWYSVPNIAVAAAIFYVISSSVVMTNAFTAGIMFFLLYYEWKHYIAHRPLQPISPWGCWMKKVHLLHHFKNENYWYGVTSPAYDYLMGTFKNQKDVAQSKTAKNLEKRGE